MRFRLFCNCRRRFLLRWPSAQRSVPKSTPGIAAAGDEERPRDPLDQGVSATGRRRAAVRCAATMGPRTGRNERAMRSASDLATPSSVASSPGPVVATLAERDHLHAATDGSVREHAGADQPSPSQAVIIQGWYCGVGGDPGRQPGSPARQRDAEVLGEHVELGRRGRPAHLARRPVRRRPAVSQQHYRPPALNAGSISSSCPAGTGWPNRNPWARSQPSACKRSNWCCVSTPSAVVLRPRLRARSMTG